MIRFCARHFLIAKRKSLCYNNFVAAAWRNGRRTALKMRRETVSVQVRLPLPLFSRSSDLLFSLWYQRFWFPAAFQTLVFITEMLTKWYFGLAKTVYFTGDFADFCGILVSDCCKSFLLNSDTFCMSRRICSNFAFMSTVYSTLISDAEHF